MTITAEQPGGVPAEWVPAALAAIGVAVIVTDGHGAILFMSPAAEALTGWSRNEAKIPTAWKHCKSCLSGWKITGIGWWSSWPAIPSRWTLYCAAIQVCHPALAGTRET